jgi:hypothetical protein
MILTDVHTPPTNENGQPSAPSACAPNEQGGADAPNEFGQYRVTHRCGHVFWTWLSGDLADNLERTLPSIESQDCGDCWHQRTFPRFVFPLGNAYVTVEEAFSITDTLRGRGYRMGHGEARQWTKRLRGKAKYRAELKWIRARGFNVWGAERRKDGRVFRVDLRERSA